MSYARFSSDSDVYVYKSVGDKRLICCACRLIPNFETAIKQNMLKHLEVHTSVGHMVPKRAIDRLKAEIADKQE